MALLTTHERFARMFAHKEADRIPISDYPWSGTIRRWHHEGMPEGMDYVDYFDLDKIANISVDNSPRYPEIILDETEDYIINTTHWGATLKNFKLEDATPDFLDFKVKDRASWADAKARMKPTRDRINWAYLRNNYPVWKKEGYWIQAGLWFGFDVTHSWMVGTERFLMALVDDPEWCVDIWNHYLDVNLALLDQVWQAGYHFDSVRWPDDMGYKNRQFFSVGLYRELLKPVHKKAIDWAHAKGVKTHLHSCGDINPFIPELVEIGLDALNPLEVKAGMDPVSLKKKFGSDLVFHGGINAVLWNDVDALDAEMRRVIPVMKESGGYIFASDHSIPNVVSLGDFRRIITLAKDLGQF
jgi:uroporphyrinogen decarboxylase